MNGLPSRWRHYGRAILHGDFLRWLWHRVWVDDIPGRSAQLSYYLLLSLFPLLICLSALLAYVFAAETAVERRLLAYLGSAMPTAAMDLVRATLDDLLRERGGGKLSFGLLLALWLASSGMEAIIEGLNVAFQVEEVRPWWRRRLVALGLTLAVALLAGCALGLALASNWGSERLFRLLGLSESWALAWWLLQWAISISFLLTAIALIYYLGPNLKARRGTQIILPGAVASLMCWMVASAALRLYLDHFSSFGKTYGSLGAVIALLLWLYLSGAALLMGAEINMGTHARYACSVHSRGSPEAGQ